MMNSNNVISLVLALALALVVITAECNHEVDVLYGWRVKLSDPNNVLQSWDSTLINPCTWFHVTCNADNRVTRLDLGNAGLSGPLVPELGSLTSLQYLQVQVNNLSGRIPRQFGNLTNLVSLGLSQNQVSGTIPSSLGNLKSLRFMNLDGNNLSGSIPETVYRLIHSGNLQTLNVSDNQLAGTIRHPTTPAGFRITTILQDQKAI